MQFLMVLPNPFSAFDKDGVPCGLCPRDPDGDNGQPGHFVGARTDQKNTEKLQTFQHPRHELRSERQRTRYEYLGVPSIDPELAQKLATKEPIRLPVTKYYKDRLREGSIIATDLATAAAASVPRFVEPVAFFAAFVKATELPGDLGDGALPQSPDANGNVLEAPALPEGQAREGVAAVANGTPSELVTSEPESTNTKSRGKRSEG